jgi:YebC/PmpR family DNA-binding regulatory protein
MSGHSKWATIKRQKGANDMKRAQLFTKFSAAITVAVRQGGNVTDPENNFRLRLAIEAARMVNMPKENIERAIKRAESKQEANLGEAVYEGFGPGGVSVVVEALTDNKQRTVAEIKNFFDKNGGTMGAQGSVMYQFLKRGLIVIENSDKTIDDIFAIAVDAGAEDVEENEEVFQIYSRTEDLAKIRSFFIDKSIKVISAELIYKPINLMSLGSDSATIKAIEFIEKMEDLSDVQKVYSNLDISDTLMKKI